MSFFNVSNTKYTTGKYIIMFVQCPNIGNKNGKNAW